MCDKYLLVKKINVMNYHVQATIHIHSHRKFSQLRSVGGMEPFTIGCCYILVCIGMRTGMAPVLT